MSNLERAARPRIEERVSLLWIVVMLNMAFADILTFISPGSLQEMMTGYAGELKITQGLLLAFALLIEIPIIMIFLSRVLNRKVNRIANIAACAVTIAFVVGGGSATAHYVFFAGMEVAGMLLIVWTCIRWPNEKSDG
jgi:Sec-independent protein secretion pathway component TatC